jgi:pyruvate/2-oxoglutarate dehydrogenase complex dihydrolipoamide dehydrogenase (E3) component
LTVHDLLIIGSGSAGVAAAIEASEQGASVAVTEAGTIGGTCVNVGCVPSKTLLRAAEANHKAHGSTFDGVMPTGSNLDFAAILAVKFGLNYRDLIDTFHPYLTAVEGVRLAAQAFDKEVEKLSCCA